ncbi:ankyrin repeat-containing domain protein [Xylariaceae sp. FL1651]|nr:ankyrin repeat-containing domain protein [Xylariaceae sp. FL1651]
MEATVIYTWRIPIAQFCMRLLPLAPRLISLSSHENYDIEERTACNETPLYLACAGGEMDIATELISRGASASVTCTEFGISCLHWVFTHIEPFLSSAIVKLKEAEADIDAIAVEPVPFPHYPFILPAGTALDWAIATSSHTATRVLIEQGASLNIRNGSDPYRYDRRHDPFVFETLHLLGIHVDINAVDEEGFTVLHRLSSGNIYYTREGGSFSLLPFQGSPDTADQNLKRMISVIKYLGGNLEILTTPWTSYPNWTVESRTALMLAVESGLPNVVRALVDAGACPNTENEAGKTALFYLSERNGIDFESAKILISARADVNHRASQGKGNNALCAAAHRTNLDLVDLLLSRGANIEERGEHIGKNISSRLQMLISDTASWSMV